MTCSFRQAWPPLKIWSGTTSGTGSCQENLVHPVTFGFSGQLIFCKFKIAKTTQDRWEGELKSQSERRLALSFRYRKTLPHASPRDFGGVHQKRQVSLWALPLPMNMAHRRGQSKTQPGKQSKIWQALASSSTNCFMVSWIEVEVVIAGIDWGWAKVLLNSHGFTYFMWLTK